jgi:hypothetical protein
MQNAIQGTFHFHSTYSHDGRSTLREIASGLSRRGFSFCVMTEHFEDFDAKKLDCYVREANAVTRSTGFVLIPGIEVDLSGLHTIVFPVREYAEISRMRWVEEEAEHRVFKVLAHASKYPFELVRAHLEKYKINGLELWNQQEDSSTIPPLGFLDLLKTHSQRSQLRYFFGCDLHSVNLTVANVISLTASGQPTSEAIVAALMAGDFVSRNLPTGIEYRNGSEATDFDPWLQALLKRRYYRGKLLRSVRSCLKSFYRILPRDAQHSLNDFKNFVRNKV